MRNRREKIKFLKGLLKGERSVNEILPIKFVVVYGDSTDPVVMKENERKRKIAKNDPSVRIIRVGYK